MISAEFEARLTKTFSREAFAGRRVAITGAGSGIGRVIAHALGLLGAELFLTGRREEPLEETAAPLRERGVKVHYRTCDIREWGEVEAWVAWAEAIGPVDTLVNNAGANFVSPALAMSGNGFNAVIRTVLLGTFNITRLVGERMVGRNFGRIVALTATNAHDGSPMMIHSGASKAGVVSMMETLAVEWGPFNITANCISPGPVDSPEANQKLWPDRKTFEAVAGRAPLGGKMATPEDVTFATLFVISDAASFITGADLFVDGGHRLRSAASLNG